MNSLKDAKAVIFDMDGLLIDTEREGRIVARQVVSQMNMPQLYKVIDESVGRREEETRQAFSEVLGDIDIVNELFAKYSLALDEYRREHGIPRKSGCLELLNYLKDCGTTMALASSSHRVEVLKRLKLAGISMDYFSVVVAGDEVDKAKPNPEIYIKACQKLGVKPEDAIAIEDSPLGVKAGLGAGCKVIAIPDLQPLEKGLLLEITAQCKSLDEVIELLKK